MMRALDWSGVSAMRSYYVIAAAVVVTVASAITMHFFPNMTMHVQPPAMTGAPAQPGSCPSGAKWCQDLGGLPE
jgi:hypothetical protein